MKRIVPLLILAVAASGCALGPNTIADMARGKMPDAVPAVSFGEGYNEGLAEGVASGQRRAHGRALRIVSEYASRFDNAGCDVSTSYLPKHDRTLDQYARARESEQRLKLACARRYRWAVDAYNTIRRRLRYE